MYKRSSCARPLTNHGCGHCLSWRLLRPPRRPAATANHGQLLRQHRIRRLSAQDVLVGLRAPALRVAPRVVEAATEHIALLLPRLRLAHTQPQRCGARLEALLDKLAAVEAMRGSNASTTTSRSSGPCQEWEES